LATVRRTIGIVQGVISANRSIADRHPDHRASAERRVHEGEQELAELRSEEVALEDAVARDDQG
jgi:hypothetical protein